MYTFKTNKERNCYSCAVYKDGVFTGHGAYLSTFEEAKAFKEKVLNGLYEPYPACTDKNIR